MNLAKRSNFFRSVRGNSFFSLQKQPTFFAPGLSGVSREGRLRFTAENSTLMTYV